MKAKPKPSIRRRIFWYSVLAVVTIGSVIAIAQQDAARTPDPAAERERAELQSALALARDVRAALKDPKSLEIERVDVQTDGAVCMSYRAKNSFGAAVIGQAVRVGTTYWLSADAGDFRQRWETHCAGPGRDRTKMVVRLIDA